MNPPGNKIYRPAVGIVGGIVDELIIEAELRRGGESVAVIGLYDLLQTGVRQLSVADKDAQASGVEKRLVDAGNAVDDPGYANPVVRPSPLLTRHGDACLHGAVDVGEVPRLLRPIGPAGAGEHADVLGDLLFQVEAHARPGSGTCARR